MIPDTPDRMVRRFSVNSQVNDEVFSGHEYSIIKSGERAEKSTPCSRRVRFMQLNNNHGDSMQPSGATVFKDLTLGTLDIELEEVNGVPPSHGQNRRH